MEMILAIIGAPIKDLETNHCMGDIEWEKISRSFPQISKRQKSTKVRTNGGAATDIFGYDDMKNITSLKPSHHDIFED